MLPVFLVVLSLAVTVKAQDCTALANDGNCDFYTQCVEQQLSCGTNEYGLECGDRYCCNFKYNCFTPAVSALVFSL